MTTLTRFGSESFILTVVLAKQYQLAIYRTLRSLVQAERLKGSHVLEIGMLVTRSGEQEDFSLPQMATILGKSQRTLQRTLLQWVKSGILEPMGHHRYRITDEVYLPPHQKVHEYMETRDALRRRLYARLPETALETSRKRGVQAPRALPSQSMRGNRQIDGFHARRSLRTYRPLDLGASLR